MLFCVGLDYNFVIRSEALEQTKTNSDINVCSVGTLSI